MKILIVMFFLIVYSVSAFTQNDSTTQEVRQETITPKKVVVVSESTKALARALPKSKTTWTRIKDLFM